MCSVGSMANGHIDFDMNWGSSMSKTAKIVLGIIGALVVFVGIVIATNNSTQYIASEDLDSSMSSESSKKESAPKEKGTITVEDTVHDSKLAAAVMGLFGGWKLEDKGWEAVGNSLAARDEIDILYSADSKGQTKYQFVRIGEKESDKTPWYRLAGDELRTVIYFSGDNKELAKFKLADMIDYVNEHYSNDEIFTIKVGIYVQPAGSPTKAKLKGREITAKNTPKVVQNRATTASVSSKSAKKRVDLNQDVIDNRNLWAREIMTCVENNLDTVKKNNVSDLDDPTNELKLMVDVKQGNRNSRSESFLADYPRIYEVDYIDGNLTLPIIQSGAALIFDVTDNYLIMSIGSTGGISERSRIPLDVVEDYLNSYSGELAEIQWEN